MSIQQEWGYEKLYKIVVITSEGKRPLDRPGQLGR